MNLLLEALPSGCGIKTICIKIKATGKPADVIRLSMGEQ